MQQTAATQRYLKHYLEKDLPKAPRASQWSHCIIIPVYQESAHVLQHWLEQQFDGVNLLVIFVINRPVGSASDANHAFRAATRAHESLSCSEHIRLLHHAEKNDVLIIDLDLRQGSLAASEGVGLARKIGCDLAFAWQSTGHISDTVLCSTDADATLPTDYFSRIPATADTVAIFTFPFIHVSQSNSDVHVATLWYEMWLHHYVLGLEYARSPYTYHSLGSCLAISSECYAQVGGFPKRAGGEDFYLLNKANKTNKVIRLGGKPVQLEARLSDRVPFGTGPGVQKILQSREANEAVTFYHPLCFAALRSWLAIIPKLYAQNDTANIEILLEKQNLSKALAIASIQALKDLGVDKAFDHCRAQGKTPQQFTRQFHQWFDGFRTLKFIHALRANGCPELAFEDMLDCAPDFWPTGTRQALDAPALQKIIQDYWNWS